MNININALSPKLSQVGFQFSGFLGYIYIRVHDFIKSIHVHVHWLACTLSGCLLDTPFKFWTHCFEISSKFGHPISKSWQTPNTQPCVSLLYAVQANSFSETCGGSLRSLDKAGSFTLIAICQNKPTGQSIFPKKKSIKKI